MKAFSGFVLALTGILVLSACRSLPKSSPFGEGTSWELEYLAGPDRALDALFPDRKPEITFDSESGEVYGNSGCNGYRAPYEKEGRQLRIGPHGPSTMMYCGEGENHFRTLVRQVNAWQITKGGTLELLRDGVPLMRFHPKTGG